MTATLLALLLALAAPAPRPRPPAPLPVPAPGRYKMLWGGSAYACTLRADGVYEARDAHGGEPWRGSWGYDPRTKVLFVQESNDDVDWRLYLYTMHGLRGRTASGMVVELVPEEGKKGR